VLDCKDGSDEDGCPTIFDVLAIKTVNVNRTEVTATTAYLWWTPEDSSAVYEVVLTADGKPKLTYQTKTTNISLDHLEPFTQYRAAVRKTAAKETARDKSVTFKTKMDSKWISKVKKHPPIRPPAPTNFFHFFFGNDICLLSL
jgi:hypothetical protein